MLLLFIIIMNPPIHFCTLKMPFPQCNSYEKSRGVFSQPKFKTLNLRNEAYDIYFFGHFVWQLCNVNKNIHF